MINSVTIALRAGAGALAALALLACASTPDGAAAPDRVWVGAWASSQQIPEPRNALADADFTDVTMRQIVHLSRGGADLRVRISNLDGVAPLRFDAVHIARAVAPGSAQIQVGTDLALTFEGAPDVIVPAGAEYLSDPVPLAVSAFDDLAISFHLTAPPAQQTSHPGSRATSFYLHGDHVGDPDLPGASTIEHWYNIAGVDVTARPGAAAIVILGDSITDGHGATTDGNDRWPDFLMRRLQENPATQRLGVLNHGVGGNRLLNYGLGPAALARFDRDVLTQTGVRYLIVLEGVNDIGTFMRDGGGGPDAHAELTRRMIGAYAQMVARAHERGVQVYGATIMPFGGAGTYPSTPESEATRNAVNAWIRAPGHFDAVLDFDAVVRDPAHPDRLLPAYDSGDHLHTSPAGFRAMAEAIPLTLFSR
jgi:lysophospholipase L1-like esterase